MSLPSLKLLIQHLLTPQIYPTNPHRHIFEDDEWETWLASESAVYTNWRFKKQSPEPKGEGKRKYEWKRIYECDHAGTPRDRRNDDLSPSKRRKSKESIKVGCKAKIEVYKLFGGDVVNVDHYWKHTGHDPSTIKSMKESWNPGAVRDWLDCRVNDGFDSKAIKAMLRMTSEELAEITEEIDALPCSIKISAQDIYNAVRRKNVTTTYLSDNPDESIHLWIAKLTEKGWNAAYEKTPGEEMNSSFPLMYHSIA